MCGVSTGKLNRGEYSQGWMIVPVYLTHVLERVRGLVLSGCISIRPIYVIYRQIPKVIKDAG